LLNKLTKTLKKKINLKEQAHKKIAKNQNKSKKQIHTQNKSIKNPINKMMMFKSMEITKTNKKEDIQKEIECAP